MFGMVALLGAASGASGCYEGVESAADAELSSGASGSSDGAGDSAADAGLDDTGAPPPQMVPLEVPRVDYGGPCVERAPGERALATSPDGDLWVGRDAGTGGSLKIVSVTGTSTEHALPWPVTEVLAFSDERGLLVAEGQPWEWSTGGISAIRWPQTLSAPTQLCGDPSVEGDGLVLAGDVFSRDVGRWWRWNVPGGWVDGATTIATQAGACAGRDDVAYLHHESEVWSLSSDRVARQPIFEPATAVAVDDAFGLATAVHGELRIGAPGREPHAVIFEAGPVRTLASSAGALFVGTDARLYRHDADAVEEVVVDGASIAGSAFYTDGAGGVWVETTDRWCYRNHQIPLGITGVRPFERRQATTLDVIVDGHRPLASVSATLDGVPVEGSALEPNRWAVTAVAPDEPGWHTLEVQGVASDGDVSSRVVELFVTRAQGPTWETDIVPIFEHHCGSGPCHGPDPSGGDRPDLADYAAWVEHADAIRNRVGVVSDMPPPGVGDDRWGVDEVLLILRWLDAGLRKES